MITMKVLVKVISEKQRKFLQEMNSLAKHPVNEKRLTVWALNQKGDAPNSFSLTFTWDSYKEMNRYIEGKQYKVFLGALEVLGKKNRNQV